MNDKATQLLLPRLEILLRDFRHSREFVRYILEKKLHDKTSKQAELVHLAFETAMIVSYWRPFSKQYDFKGHAVLKLQNDVSRVLTEAQKKLHERVHERRDTDYAHSDAKSHLDENFDYGKHHLAVPYLTCMRLPKSQTVKLGEMIEAWILHIEKLRTVCVSERRAGLRELKTRQKLVSTE